MVVAGNDADLDAEICQDFTRLFFDEDVDICLLLFQYLPRAEEGTVASFGCWQFNSVSD